MTRASVRPPEPSQRSEQRPLVRSPELRPSLRQAIGRGLAVVAANALALILLAGMLRGLTVDQPANAVLAGVVLGVLNALVWPAIAVLIVPISVLTLGLGAIVLNAVVVAAALEQLPGIDIEGFGPAVAVTVGLTVVTAALTSLLALDDDAWFDQRMARRVDRQRRRRRRPTAGPVDQTPGVVFAQIDGLSEPVLRRALASGDVPTLHRWLHEGSHEVSRWQTEWSSQTGVGQCGILHGSVVDMPGFRWLEKDTGTLFVSNNPASAAVIEQRHSTGNGLLAHHGSSYGNLFSGDAERAVMTMSSAGRVKEGRVGAGYGRYFARPGNTIRTMVTAASEVARERRAAADQRRRDVQPRVDRSWTYTLLRAFTTVISRDVCVHGVLGDMAEGRAAIYVNLLGYDEVAHHSGPERSDTLAVLRDIDQQLARIERAIRWAPRPYHVVVLSDHGQTQGATFRDRWGESFSDLVERLTGASAAVDPDSAAGNTESAAWLRSARAREHHLVDAAAGSGESDLVADSDLTVLASGSLGLVYLPGPRRRLTLEEIQERYPELVDGLRAHPGIGFTLVRSSVQGSMVVGPDGHRVLGADGAPDTVEGEDPLAPLGADAVDKVRRVDGYRNVADLMVNARYDPVNHEIPAFEEQVGSHGGLGGAQNHPFVMFPAQFARPSQLIDGPAALHRILKGWLVDLGHPVVIDDELAVS